MIYKSDRCQIIQTNIEPDYYLEIIIERNIYIKTKKLSTI